MENENEKVTACCDTCDNTDYATKTELISIGWYIEELITLCPLCNFG